MTNRPTESSKKEVERPSNSSLATSRCGRLASEFSALHVKSAARPQGELSKVWSVAKGWFPKGVLADVPLPPKQG